MGQVVVVGAGVGGLTAAVWLADLGHEVTILERRDRPGGQLDAGVPGPTTLTLPAVLRDLFGKTGRRLDRELTLRPADPAVRYLTSVGPVVLPHASRAGTLAAIDQAFGDSAAGEWDRLMRRAADIWASIRPTFVDRPPTVRGVARLAMARTSRRAAFGTLDALLTELDIAHPAVREIVAAHAITTGADPRSGPAMVATGPYVEQTFGTWTVDGGPTALVDALARRARERGADLRTHTAAARYEAVRRRIVAVHSAAGDRFPADAVVSAVPEAEHRRLLGGARSGVSGRRSVATIVLDGPDPIRSGADAVRTVATRIERAPLCVVEYPQGGGVVIHVDVRRDDRLDDAWADAVLAGLARRGLSLDSTRSTSRRRLYTPDQWAVDLGLGTGSPYGIPATDRWAAFRRPRAQSTTRGLFRVGAAANPGPGIHSVALSAAVVADLIGRPTGRRT